MTDAHVPDEQMPADIGRLPDLAAIAATDAWLDDVAAGRAEAGDSLAASMVEWLGALDAGHGGARAPISAADDSTSRASLRRLSEASAQRRRSRRAIAAGAVAAAMLVGAGSAAAMPGSPVHRALFGTPTPTPHVAADAARIAQIRALLESAEQLVASAEHGRHIDLASRESVMTLLTDARTRSQLLADAGMRAALLGQCDELQRRLDALADTNLPTVQTVAPTARPSERTRTPQPTATETDGQRPAPNDGGSQVASSEAGPQTGGGETEDRETEPEASETAEGHADINDDAGSDTQDSETPSPVRTSATAESSGSAEPADSPEPTSTTQTAEAQDATDASVDG